MNHKLVKLHGSNHKPLVKFVIDLLFNDNMLVITFFSNVPIVVDSG